MGRRGRGGEDSGADPGQRVIRCAPSMYTAPVGMLGLEDANIVTDVRNLGSGECWVRLEKETAEKFAFNTVDSEVCIIIISLK